jgi:protein tyrosine/serine phosphatase
VTTPALHARAAFLVPVLLLAACCSGPPDDTKGSLAATRPAGVPIDNFAEVAPGIYRGAQPDEAGFQALKALGVKTIVTMREKHDDRAHAGPLGIEVVHIPMHATLSITPPTDDEIRTFLAAVVDPAKQPVFFHCAAGKDRTGTMCAMYRMEVQGWTAEKAHEEMVSFGWHDDVYPELGKFVLGWKPKGLAPTVR